MLRAASAALLCAALLAGGCATVPGAGAAVPEDPWENFNRKVYAFNDTVDEAVMKPVAKAYKEAATLRVPVHRHERKRDGPTPSAYTVMHQLAWELIPSLEGVFADLLPRREARRE